MPFYTNKVYQNIFTACQVMYFHQILPMQIKWPWPPTFTQPLRPRHCIKDVQSMLKTVYLASATDTTDHGGIRCYNLTYCSHACYHYDMHALDTSTISVLKNFWQKYYAEQRVYNKKHERSQNETRTRDRVIWWLAALLWHRCWHPANTTEDVYCLQWPTDHGDWGFWPPNPPFSWGSGTPV